MLTRVVEIQIWKNYKHVDSENDILVCTPCLEANSYTVKYEAETKDAPDSECEFSEHG